MSEVAKGFRRGRFCDLADRDKRDLLKLIARVAEQAYRRGVQQGGGLAGKPSFRGDLWEWLSSIARRIAVDRSADDHHEPRSPEYRVRRATPRARLCEKRWRCRLVAAELARSPMAACLDRLHARAAPSDPGREQARYHIEGPAMKPAPTPQLSL